MVHHCQSFDVTRSPSFRDETGVMSGRIGATGVGGEKAKGQVFRAHDEMRSHCFVTSIVRYS
jgi:hypothetical protein